MCESLRVITQFVEGSIGPATKGDAVRLACNHCQDSEKCSYVTSREYDARALAPKTSTAGLALLLN